MRKFLSILVIVGLIIAQVGISQPVQAQGDGFYILSPATPSIDGNIYRLTFDIVNLSNTTIYHLPNLTATWDGNLQMYGIYTNSYRWGFSTPSPSPAVWTPYLSYMYPYFTIPAGGSTQIILEWTNYTDTAPSNVTFNGQNTSIGATPTPGTTPTPYGGATATPTPTPTETPRPNVESTVVAQMVAASNSISVSMQNIQPYDWQSGGATSNFPDLFNGAIAPYFSQIFSYMLALMEIVNTNNVVVIIFILTIGISILMIVIKMVSGGALAGWKESGIPDAVNDPYRSINKRK